MAEILFYLNKDEHIEKLYLKINSLLSEITNYKFEIWNINNIKPYLQLPDDTDPTSSVNKVPNFISKYYFFLKFLNSDIVLSIDFKFSDPKIFHLPEEKPIDWIYQTYKYIFNKS